MQTLPHPKTKYPRAVALEVVRGLMPHLVPACEPERFIIAGSLRRRKLEVGDIEILFIPRFTEVKEDFFSTRKVSLVDVALERLLLEGVLEKRTNVKGSAVWGEKNKLARHVSTGIPIDLFLANRKNWFNYLVCRTGNAASNIAICQASQRKGWKWNPYGPGFTNDTGGITHVLEERHAFELVGLKYLEPWERNL